MANETRTFRFSITFNVEPAHPAYDDPEWAAGAAWGALTNMYSLRAFYAVPEEIEYDGPI